ncbi:MAG: UDP-N-acetylmuramoyl-L-alanyl-D-glutamate--2,6-diaminopimelate ligase, partial [Phycisphaerae bacterium]
LAADATAVINIDDPWGQRMAQDCQARVLRLSLKGAADWAARIIDMDIHGMTLDLAGPGVEARFRSPLVGRHNAYNSLMAAAAAYSQGVPIETVVAGLQAMTGVPGRLQAVRAADSGLGALPFQVFVDYAHTHDALENVLTALRATMKAPGKLICLFGCGGDRDRTKRPKMAAVAERLADRVVITSDNPRTEDPRAIIAEVVQGISAGGKGKVSVEPDRRAAIRLAIGLAAAGDVVLLAGKGHENYQIIGTTKRHFDDVEEALAILNNTTDDQDEPQRHRDTEATDGMQNAKCKI